MENKRGFCKKVSSELLCIVLLPLLRVPKLPLLSFLATLGPLFRPSLSRNYLITYQLDLACLKHLSLIFCFYRMHQWNHQPCPILSSCPKLLFSCLRNHMVSESKNIICVWEPHHPLTSQSVCGWDEFTLLVDMHATPHFLASAVGSTSSVH